VFGTNDNVYKLTKGDPIEVIVAEDGYGNSKVKIHGKVDKVSRIFLDMISEPIN
jgi:hypothetical protein